MLATAPPGADNPLTATYSTGATPMNPGCIVRCRNRDWVLLPSDDAEVYLLRPLTGATDEVVAVHKQLAELVGYELPEERLRSATFPLPTEADVCRRRQRPSAVAGRAA